MGSRQMIENNLGKLNDDDRSQLCSLLIKAGYTARIAKVKEGNKAARYCIEYWKEDE